LKTVASDALGIVNRALGITGSGAPRTEFPDGILDQVLDVGPLVRRGRTQAATQGIYNAVLRTVHTDAETLSTAVAPYFPGANSRPPYPDPVPVQFDIWLLGASVRQISGGGTISALLAVQYGAAALGWGEDDSGVAVTLNSDISLAHWDALATVSTEFAILNGARGPWARFGLRLPRHPDTSLVFRCTSSVTATFDCNLLLGVFPVALGQDIAV